MQYRKKQADYLPQDKNSERMCRSHFDKHPKSE